MWLYHRSPSPSSHPKLTPHSEVDFQLADGEGVLAAAEVDAFVILADVEYGQLEDGAFLRQRVLGTRYNVLLLEPLSPGGVCRRDGDGLSADQSDAGVLLSRDQRLTFRIRRLWEGRGGNMICPKSLSVIVSVSVQKYIIMITDWLFEGGVVCTGFIFVY